MKRAARRHSMEALRTVLPGEETRSLPSACHEVAHGQSQHNTDQKNPVATATQMKRTAAAHVHEEADDERLSSVLFPGRLPGSSPAAVCGAIVVVGSPS